MNCYEWRKHITGSVAVTVSYNEVGDGYTLSGGGTVTNKTLYAGWTHRELQCVGAPLSWPDDWILRGDNLCEGRAQIIGLLTQANTIPVTYTPEEGDPVTEEWSVYFQIVPNNYDVISTLLPLQPYPDWENDPYSVATRQAIDALQNDMLLVCFSSAPPSPGFPAVTHVPLRWFKDGLSGVSADGRLTASLAINFSLA